MTSAIFLMTSRVLPVPRAALQTDRRALMELAGKHPKTANSLTPATDLFASNRARLVEVAQIGIEGLRQAVAILAKNGTLLALIVLAPAAFAGEATPQSTAAIQKAAHEFILTHARAYGGEPRIEVGAPDPRLQLARCDQPLIAELPPGSRPVGATTVGVRCPGSSPWSIYVPVRVRIFADILVAARPLARGVPLTHTDVIYSRQDLAAVAGNALTDASQAIGKRLRYPVATGAALNAGLLDLPPLVKRGQAVTIVSIGQGLEVRAAGEALADGTSGETIRVRNQLTKKTIQATVLETGLVRVSM